MPFITRRKTNPCGCVWKFLEQLCNCLRFSEAWNRFARQRVCACCEQRFHAWTMKVHQLFFGESILAAIFRAICQERAVGSHRRGDEGLCSSKAMCFISPKFIARFDSKFDRFLNQSDGFFFV